MYLYFNIRVDFSTEIKFCNIILYNGYSWGPMFNKHINKAFKGLNGWECVLSLTSPSGPSSPLTIQQ